MSVRIGRLFLDDWRSLPLAGGWSDTFIFTMSAAAGLPPREYALLIRRMIPHLAALRRSASLWVQIVDAGGEWYRRVVEQTLRGIRLPYAVTNGDMPPSAAAFSFRVWTDVVPSPPPPRGDFDRETGLSAAGTAALRTLARLGSAYTAEIASLAGLERQAAGKILRELREQKLVEQEQSVFPRWRIARNGLILALRSWGVPPRVPFTARRENRLQTGSGHQRTARLWTAWLKRAWRNAEVWTGWSELALNRSLYPDALAWGKTGGYETLFWLEVETGHLSREQIRRKIHRRFEGAAAYARDYGIRLVFAVLAPNWVREAAAVVFREIPPFAAVVISDWKSFGVLPPARWGELGLSGEARTKSGNERKRKHFERFLEKRIRENL